MRQLQGVVRAQRRRSRSRAGRVRANLLRPYLLLITPGNDKYARETARGNRGLRGARLPIIRVLSDSREVQSDAPEPVSLTDMLTAGDHARILALWLREVLRLGRRWLERDRKARSLSVAAIPGIRQYYLDLAFARRIGRRYGRPRAVLSLAPWSDTSVAIVDVMKARGVATGATRTQTTMDVEEYLTINADLLFCKSAWERAIYGRLFRGHGPRLVDGCLLSLPEEYPLEPLALPEPFVLLLGTTRQWNQSEAAYRQVSTNLERVAAVPGLPVVYRAHPAHAAKIEHAAGSAAPGAMVVVADLRRNLELIAKASLVVSAHSTLLYQAILAGTPTVVVHIDPPDAPADEFIGSPLLRIRPEQIDGLRPEDLAPAGQLAADAQRLVRLQLLPGPGSRVPGRPAARASGLTAAMRILLVSPGMPVPGEAGSPRTFQLARQLAARHTIHLLVVARGAAGDPAVLARYRGQESPFRGVSVAPVERDARTARQRLANAMRGDPWFATRRLRPAEHAAALRAVAAAATDCDVIWADTLPMVQYAAGTGRPLVVDEVDYMSRLAGAEARLRPSRLGRFLGRWRASLIRRYELRTLPAAAAVVLISPVEATLLERDLRVPVDVVRNGCDTDYFAPSAGARRLPGAPSLLFVGNLAYGPNHDAARFIINELAPAVTDRFPGARFHVVGPPADIAAPGGSPVEVVGFVDDIRPWYAGADVFLCPLRYGAGLKNKVLEAAAMGCAIVASDVAVEGTGFRDGEHYLHAGTPQEYVERLSALLADPDRRAALGAAARAAVVANYSWVRAAATFEAILDRVARRRL